MSQNYRRVAIMTFPKPSEHHWEGARKMGSPAICVKSASSCLPPGDIAIRRPAARRFSCRGRLTRASAQHFRSARVQYTLAQQVEVGPVVHLPLDQLQAIDLAFDLPIAPEAFDGLDDGRIILLQVPRVLAQAARRPARPLWPPGQSAHAAGPTPAAMLRSGCAKDASDRQLEWPGGRRPLRREHNPRHDPG